MGMLTRFKDIMSSNINAMLDKMENPEKMIDQTIRNLEKDLKEVKSETAGIMAEETRAVRKYEECQAEVDKLTAYAVKALEAGKEADARKFLEKKSKREGELNALHQAAEVAELNAKRMCNMHTKLSTDVDALKAKQAELKAKLKTAAAQEKINKMVSSSPDSSDSIAAFARFEEKANLALDKANAMAKLNATEEDEMDDLMAKYGNTPSSSVDDELAMLKASLKK